jgi:hypothetical protein
MLKRAKQWYADTHRHNRYGWGITISGAIGLAVFCYQMWEGVGYSQAYFGGGMTFFFATAVLVFPQGIFDWFRGIRNSGWKGPQLDEMEKAIYRRVRGISFMAFYAYIGAALLGIMAYYEALGIDQIPSELLRTTLMGGLLVLLWSQGIALVILYGRQGSMGDIPKTLEQAKTEP